MEDMEIITRKEDFSAAMAEAAAQIDAENLAADEADQHGVIIIAGKPHMTDAKGRFVPLDMIRDTDKLEDQLVRKVLAFAEPLAAQVARFRQHCFDDVDAFIALLDEQYKVKRGGQKGNVTFTSFDGLHKVQVAMADHVSFGPELQQAKSLVDECVREWTDGARSELVALIDQAFQTDKEGKINRERLLTLRRLKIEDERWQRAMEAVTAAERVIGSKRYVRIYTRTRPIDPWTAVSIDVAAGAAA